MSENDPRLAALDARMRRLYAGVDARAGFEERLAARIAAMAPAPRADLRAQFDRRRERVRVRLRREAWSNGVMVAGVGVAAAALYWQYASVIERLIVASTQGPGPVWITAVTLAFLGACLAPILIRR